MRVCDEDGGNGETGEGWKDKRDGRDRRGAYSEEEMDLKPKVMWTKG